MAKTEVVRARVTESVKLALVELADCPRGESDALRMLVHEGLQRRGLWPIKEARNARKAA